MARYLTLVAATLALVVLVGCGGDDNTKKMKEGMRQTWDGLKGWSSTQKDQAMEFVSKQMDGMDDKLAVAMKKASEVGGEASEALGDKWKTVQEKYGALKDAGGENWDQARDAFVSAYEAFKQQMAETDGE